MWFWLRCIYENQDFGVSSFDYFLAMQYVFVLANLQDCYTANAAVEMLLKF